MRRNTIMLLIVASYFVWAQQELQRRLDQTLGKPGSYLAGIDRVGNLKPMTVGARLYRVEQHLSVMDKKLDLILVGVTSLGHQRITNSVSQPLNIPAAPSQASSPTPVRLLEGDV